MTRCHGATTLLPVGAHWPRRLIAWTGLVVILLAAESCCLTGGWHECDSATYVGGCRGNHLTMCLRTASPWSGEYEELIDMDCGAGEVCIEAYPGGPACVVAPARRCDPETHVGHCDGNTPVVCMSPNSWVTENFEIRGS